MNWDEALSDLQRSQERVGAAAQEVVRSFQAYKGRNKSQYTKSQKRKKRVKRSKRIRGKQ